MRGFEYYMPTKLVFGRGKVMETGKIVAAYGKKAMIVTGKNSTKKTGLLDKVINLLKLQELEYYIFDKVEENPLTTLVEEGKAVVLSEGCDVILGLGGGSALDAAKGIAFMAVNDGDVSEYIFGKPGKGALPIIAVTTTAGTGSEGDSLAVLTNPDTNDKKSLKSSYIYPKVSIVDPELMTTLPKHLVAATGFDALCHCIEAYVANRSTFISDLIALKGIELISTGLPRVYDDSNDLEAWNSMALANTFGGMAIDMAGVALAHGLEHSVSGLLNVRHGEGLAALLINFMEFSYSSAPARFADIAKALGEDISVLSIEEAARRSIDAVKKLMDRVELKFDLSSLGVKGEHIDWLVQNSMKTMTYAISNNPRIPDTEDLKKLYMACL